MITDVVIKLTHWVSQSLPSLTGLSGDQIMAGANGMWIGGAILVIALIVKGLMVSRKHHRVLPHDALLLCVGAMCSSFGVLLHRGYWNLVIFSRQPDVAYADWAIDQRYIPSAAVVFITAGILIATSRYGPLYYGTARWICLVIGVLSVCGATSVMLST